MKNTKSWKDYVPQSVSLYHADYRENLDEYEDLQDRCIRENNLRSDGHRGKTGRVWEVL